MHDSQKSGLRVKGYAVPITEPSLDFSQCTTFVPRSIRSTTVPTNTSFRTKHKITIGNLVRTTASSARCHRYDAGPHEAEAAICQGC